MPKRGQRQRRGWHSSKKNHRVLYKSSFAHYSPTTHSLLARYSLTIRPRYSLTICCKALKHAEESIAEELNDKTIQVPIHSLFTTVIQYFSITICSLLAADCRTNAQEPGFLTASFAVPLLRMLKHSSLIGLLQELRLANDETLHELDEMTQRALAAEQRLQEAAEFEEQKKDNTEQVNSLLFEEMQRSNDLQAEAIHYSLTTCSSFTQFYARRQRLMRSVLSGRKSVRRLRTSSWSRKKGHYSLTIRALFAHSGVKGLSRLRWSCGVGKLAFWFTIYQLVAHDSVTIQARGRG